MKRMKNRTETAELLGIPVHAVDKLRKLGYLARENGPGFSLESIAEIMPTGNFPGDVKGLVVHMGVDDEGFIPLPWFDATLGSAYPEAKKRNNRNLTQIKTARIDAEQTFPDTVKFSGWWPVARGRHNTLTSGGKVLVASYAGLILEGGWIVGSVEIEDEDRVYAVIPFSNDERQRFLRKRIIAKGGSITQDL